MKAHTLKHIRITILSLCMLASSASVASAGVQAEYQYMLSNFWGTVPSLWAQLTLDHENNEIYALDLNESLVRVFSESGMELQDFGQDFRTVHPVSLAVSEAGNLFVLSSRYQGWDLFQCNYRGDVGPAIVMQGLPQSFGDFNPGRVEYHNGSLYLVDSPAMLVAVIDQSGRFLRGYDLSDLVRADFTNSSSSGRVKSEAALAKITKQLLDIEVGGFSVDASGTMYFTVPVLFSAYRLHTDGSLEGFGIAGGGPGKFGVVAGIAADEHGFIYVTDRLRCVVMVFDPSLIFQNEFGYRGPGQDNLLVPDDVEIDGRGYLYVAQAANRGVSVFKITGQE